MIDRDEGEKDLSNVRAQISVIEQELSKVQLMNDNLARLRGVEAYLNNKINPPQEVPAETAEEEA